MPTSLASLPGASSLAVNGGTPVAPNGVPMIAVKLSEAQIDAAVEVMRSGMLAQGKNVAALEEQFGAATGATHAIACANGTCALQLAYEILVEPGDDVLVPAWSYIATASMLVARGANPIWVDADPVTYCIDVDDAKAKLTPGTTAIAATHIYGNPVNIAGIERLAIDHGLAVIYDAAQSHLATYDGQGLGGYGDAVTYSFYATKNMTTGEGGMVTTKDEVTAAALRSVRSHGETQKYVHDRVGFNYRMSDLEAAVGRHQLADLPTITERRRANARALDAALAEIEGVHAPVATDRAEHAYHLYPARLDPEQFIEPEDDRPIRDVVAEALKAEGIGSAVHYPRSLTRQPVFEKPGMEHPPVADHLASTLLCLPVHQHLTEQQVSQVGDAVQKVLTALRR
ncbi:MAG: DegT/DnrJ/EryC1/StrS family aminotransferase [Planctomycetota bacterium]